MDIALCNCHTIASLRSAAWILQMQFAFQLPILIHTHEPAMCVLLIYAHEIAETWHDSCSCIVFARDHSN